MKAMRTSAGIRQRRDNNKVFSLRKGIGSIFELRNNQYIFVSFFNNFNINIILDITKE